MSAQGPIFIGGAGRSGTTLVADMIGLHPRISPIYETGFVSQVAGLIFGRRDLPMAQVQVSVLQVMDRWSQGLPMLPHYKRPHERYHHGPHYIRFDRAFAMARTVELVDALEAGQPREGFRAFIASLCAEHARLDAKPRWANKTPSYVHLLPVLADAFPEMKFIHCVRDGRAVAASVITRPWGPSTFPEAARWWARKARQGLIWGRANPDRYFEVRYEALLRRPAATLSGLLGFLGEADCAAEMLDAYRGGIALEPERADSWRRRLSVADLAAFDAVAGDLLAALGYREDEMAMAASAK